MQLMTSFSLVNQLATLRIAGPPQYCFAFQKARFCAIETGENKTREVMDRQMNMDPQTPPKPVRLPGSLMIFEPQSPRQSSATFGKKAAQMVSS